MPFQDRKKAEAGRREELKYPRSAAKGRSGGPSKKAAKGQPSELQDQEPSAAGRPDKARDARPAGRDAGTAGRDAGTAGRDARSAPPAREAQAASSGQKAAGKRHLGGPARPADGQPAAGGQAAGARGEGRPAGAKEKPEGAQGKPAGAKGKPGKPVVEVAAEKIAPEKPVIPVKRAGYAAMVGRSNMGKSTLMNVLLGEALSIVSPIPQTTRNRVLGVVRSGDAQIGLLDTPGLHKPKTRLGQMMNTTARNAVDEADVVLFVTAPPSNPTGQPLRVSAGDRTLLADIGKGKPTILVINKVDLIKPRSDVLPLIEEFSKIRDFVAIVPISARREDGLERLLGEIAPHLPEREALWPDDELTDQPVRFFVGEFVREEILRMAREELPYVVAVTVDSYDEAGRIPRIFASIHVEREGQKPIVIGQGGTMLREIGTAARARVEDLLGQQVHLELHVRVTPGWSNDPKVLREFGYDEAKAP